MLYYIIYLYYC